MRPIEKVMLIYPPVTFSPQSMKQCHPPLGLAYIAAVLRDKVELEVLDAAAEGWHHEERAGNKLLRYGLSFDEVQRRIEKFRPDMVGISCIFSSQFRNVAELCRRVKEIDPETVTITGGTHPTFLSRYCMENCPELDMIGRGEGEFIMEELVESSRKGVGPADIDGLTWRDGDNIVINPAREVYPDVDEIPFPARDLFKLPVYDKICQPMGMVFKRTPFMNIITSRGCPYKCTFCSSTNFWGNVYRPRSVENVLDEMEELHKNYGINEFKFFDDNLTSNRARAKALFQGMIDRGIDVAWNTPNGVHVINMDEEMLDLMVESGCHELTLAVESGDQDVLKNIIHKPTRLDQLEEATKRIKERKIGTNGFFIIGFPGETKEQIKKTLDFSRKLDLDRVSFFTFTPLPGTYLYNLCVEKGYIDPAKVNEDVDYFEAPIDTPEWTHEELDDLRRRWFWKFNLSLLLRHPLWFFTRYSNILKRPGMVWDIMKRRLRR